METGKPEIKIKSSIEQTETPSSQNSVLDNPEEKIKAVKPIIIKKKISHMSELL